MYYNMQGLGDSRAHMIGTTSRTPSLPTTLARRRHAGYLQIALKRRYSIVHIFVCTVASS